MAALSLLLLLVLGGTSAWAQLPAFPGAEGFGAGAVGGRNGDVYIVDSLADTNTLGTLRHAVNTAPGASRTIVFNTSGTITLNTNLEITQSNITIAGQTAPGLGITLKGKTLRVLGSNNIVRHVHVRVGQAGADIDSAAVEGGVNNILDHVSGSWSGDEVISVADTASLATVQWSFMHEALNYENHAYGSLIRPDNDSKVSYHHNFYAHNRSRNARIGTYNGSLLEFEFRNNVIFDWIDEVTYSGGSNEFVDVNFIGNYGVAGPSTGSKVNRLFSGGSTNTEIYQEGNYSDGNQDPNRDGVLAPFTSPYFVNDFTPKADAPFSFSGLTYPVTTSSAPDAYDDILDHGGAFFWNRDANDLRVIDQLETMQGGIILTEADVGGFVSIPVVTRPAGWDSDGDGMPGDWELDHGLDPDSAADRTGDFDLDGYNNLEEYLNDVGAFPGPQPIVFDGSTDDKYAKISNWDINWQPSRYDEVRIHNSTVIVDAVGQHAGTLQLGPDPNDSATLRVTNGWLKVADDVEVGSGSGTGTLSVSTGAFAEATNVNVNTLGTLTGGGEIVGDVINSGIVSPGVFIGEMTVDGSFEQEPNGTLFMQIERETTGMYDRLLVDGAIMAGGTLSVEFFPTFPGYVPAVGHSFDLLDFTSLGGSFALDLPTLGSGLAWDTDDLLSTGVLSIVPAENADFNEDGKVDGTDFLIWQRGFNSAGGLAMGDADGNGFVDNADLAIWENQYGTTNLLAASATVPEPGTALLLMLTAVGMITQRANRA